MRSLYITFLLFFSATLFSQEKILVSNIDEYKTAIKSAVPGTKIVLKNGIWRDIKLEAFGKGTKENPITLKTNIKKVSYGEAPSTYQKILKEHLIKKLKNYKTAKVEFINEPSKISIDHLGDTYSGYRVCLSINERIGDYYKGYRNHFFLINQEQVILHLFDSGLLTIPFEYCVSRDTTNEIYIDDIPDDNIDITIDKMDSVTISKKKEGRGNTYISCLFNEKEVTYVFNEQQEVFKKLDGLTEAIYSVKFNEAFIVATYLNDKLTINRVSGNATLLKDTSVPGTCKLTSKTKF